jgi:galactose mutarotase-like enzyme
MATDLQITTWYGLPAWRFESARLRVITVPSLGGKLVSLFDKRSGWEWLAQPNSPPAREIPYAANFLEFSLFGWDEMFPTINGCPYPASGPFYGKALPDHGEVWALPWEIKNASGEALELSVEGRALPYGLSRSLALSGSDCLLMRYRLTNLSNQPLLYLWAAHPLFRCDESTQIVLPDEVQEVWNVQSSECWGPAGAIYSWPLAAGREGLETDLSRVGPAERRSSRKFYLPSDTHSSWAGLVHSASGSVLRLDWEPGSVPYLGLWVDEGRYTVQPTAALEPATGFYDGLDVAYRNECASLLPPGAVHDWELAVRTESSE